MPPPADSTRNSIGQSLEANNDQTMSNSPLEKLPAELRIAIYELVMTRKNYVEIVNLYGSTLFFCSPGGSLASGYEDINTFALTRVSKKVRQESLPIFFATNTFVFQNRVSDTEYCWYISMSDEYLGTDMRHLSEILGKLDLTLRSKIPKLVLNIEHFGVKGHGECRTFEIAGGAIKDVVLKATGGLGIRADRIFVRFVMKWTNLSACARVLFLRNSPGRDAVWNDQNLEPSMPVEVPLAARAGFASASSRIDQAYDHAVEQIGHDLGRYGEKGNALKRHKISTLMGVRQSLLGVVKKWYACEEKV